MFGADTLSRFTATVPALALDIIVFTVLFGVTVVAALLSVDILAILVSWIAAVTLMVELVMTLLAMLFWG